MNHAAFRAFAWNKVRAVVAGSKCACLVIPAQIGALLFRAVTGITTLGEQWLDVLRKHHRTRRCGREFRYIRGNGGTGRSQQHRDNACRLATDKLEWKTVCHALGLNWYPASRGNDIPTGRAKGRL
jgi:hypothetical protein